MSSSWSQEIEKAAQHIADNDPVLAPTINNGLRPTFTPHSNYYQAIVESIVSQQLSVKAADTILKRFVALFSSDFPSPEEILEKDIEDFRGVGLSRQKGSYIRDLAQRVLDGSVRFEHLDSLTNDEIIAELVQVKGVGVWTVHMFLMFCMGRLDVFPTGDLGIKNGIYKLYDLKEKPTPEEMEKIAKKYKWHPYETIASWYIWQSLDNTPPIEQIIEP